MTMTEFESYPAGPDAYDEALSIQMVRQGNAEAFTDIYNEYHDVVRGSLINKVRGQLDDMTLDDIVQDTFTKAYVNMDTYEDVAKSLRPWLITIAHNNLMDHFRKQARRDRIEGAGMPDDYEDKNRPDDFFAPTFAARAIMSYLVSEQVISEEQMDALWAQKVMEMKGEEYADTRGVALMTARTRTNRAKQGINKRFSKPSELLDAVFPDA